MTARDLIGSGLHVIASGTVTMATATTTAVDFGDPNDINLATVTAEAPGLDYVHEDRVVVVLAAVSDGTTNTTSFSVQDADDSSGSIGTPATAITDGTLTGGTGSQYAVVGVRVQSDRPWLRVRATSDGADDTIVVGCVVLGVPRGL